MIKVILTKEQGQQLYHFLDVAKIEFVKDLDMDRQNLSEDELSLAEKIFSMVDNVKRQINEGM